MGNTDSGWRGRLRASGETLDMVGSGLSEHWRSAARLTPTRLFWQAPTRWLKAAPVAVTLRAHHFTSGGRLIR
jgi:hypothetical protein